MDLNDLANLIKSRRSVRVWQNKEVPEDLLLKAIELATWAPSGGNQQNWRFYIIKNRAILKAFGAAVQNSSELINSWPEAAKFHNPNAPLPQRGAGFFSEAPAAIAVAAANYQSQVDQILEAREKIDPQAAEIRLWRNIADSRIQSVASAIAHLLLILHQMGLGTVWMTGPIQAKRDLEHLLNVPANLDVVAFIPVGYPAETPVSRGRRPVSEVSEIIR